MANEERDREIEEAIIEMINNEMESISEEAAEVIAVSMVRREYLLKGFETGTLRLEDIQAVDDAMKTNEDLLVEMFQKLKRATGEKTIDKLFDKAQIRCLKKWRQESEESKTKPYPASYN